MFTVNLQNGARLVLSGGRIKDADGRRFLRHKRALKHSLAGEAFGLPGDCETTFRRPHPAIPRRVAPQQSLLLFHWINRLVSRFRFRSVL